MNNDVPALRSPITRDRQTVAPHPGSGAAALQSTYPWRDGAWMESRALHSSPRSPIAIYAVHLNSWMRLLPEGSRAPAYRELAPQLADYVQRHGFTHLQLSLTSSPLPDPRFHSNSSNQEQGQGGPQDFMFLIDFLHQESIGVILSWSPGPARESNEAGTAGQPPADFLIPGDGPSGQGGARAFDFACPEARQFLLNHARSWLADYHIDGLFVDLDLLKRPDAESAQENSAAVEFLQQLNEMIAADFPAVNTYAMESSGWSHVTHAVQDGGLGFTCKWDMEWRRDTLSYLSQDPLFRKYHHGQFQRRERNARETGKRVLPLAEGSQGPSILSMMPGDDWQRFANLRLLLAYQSAWPGSKLLFMGTEFGQWNRWDPNKSLDWHLIQPRNAHNSLQKLIGHLNWLYRHEPALHRYHDSADAFEWVDKDDADQSTLAFMRKSDTGTQDDVVLALFNFTPVPRHNRRFGVPRGGYWREILNTDSVDYGGSGQGNLGGLESAPLGWNSQTHSLHVTLPPLGAVFFRHAATDPGPIKTPIGS